jgi:hypothetical protein
VVTFDAPPSNGPAVTGYTVTANPGAITATGSAPPITISGLTLAADYTFSIRANGPSGDSVAVSTGVLGFFDVVETFDEPMTEPNNTIFTGTFTFDYTARAVSNLTGTLTESMTGPPMSTVALIYQLSSVPAPVGDGGVDGLLVTTFALNNTNVFKGGGFAPGGIDYYGDGTTTPNNHNAYAMIFVNTTEPSTAVVQAQIGHLAYADCTAGGMMGQACMTGTAVAGYGTAGTMDGYPISEVVTKR